MKQEYKVGDEVTIRQWDDMEEEFGLDGNGYIKTGPRGVKFNKSMGAYCGKKVTLTSSGFADGFEGRVGDGPAEWNFTAPMFEPKPATEPKFTNHEAYIEAIDQTMKKYAQCVAEGVGYSFSCAGCALCETAVTLDGCCAGSDAPKSCTSCPWVKITGSNCMKRGATKQADYPARIAELAEWKRMYQEDWEMAKAPEKKGWEPVVGEKIVCRDLEGVVVFVRPKFEPMNGAKFTVPEKGLLMLAEGCIRWRHIENCKPIDNKG